MKTLPIRIEYDQITGTTLNTKYKLKVSGSVGKEYITIDELQTLSNLSTRTLEREIKRIKETKRLSLVLNINNTRYFNPSILFLLRKYRKTLNHQELSEFLSSYNWTFAMCFGFDGERNKEYVRSAITRYWNKLSKSLPDTKLMIFYTTEKYPLSKGHHIHAIVCVGDEKAEKKVETITKTMFAYNHDSNNWIQYYNGNKCYIDYMMKDLDKNPDGYGMEFQNL